jgi:hypothetical protein
MNQRDPRTPPSPAVDAPRSEVDAPEAKTAENEVPDAERENADAPEVEDRPHGNPRFLIHLFG